jgi:hypothetical protein
MYIPYTIFSKATRILEPISYRGALLSTLNMPLCTFLHNVPNVLLQTANEMGFEKITHYIKHFTIQINSRPKRGASRFILIS